MSFFLSVYTLNCFYQQHIYFFIHLYRNKKILVCKNILLSYIISDGKALFNCLMFTMKYKIYFPQWQLIYLITKLSINNNWMKIHQISSEVMVCFSKLSFTYSMKCLFLNGIHKDQVVTGISKLLLVLVNVLGLTSQWIPPFKTDFSFSDITVPSELWGSTYLTPSSTEKTTCRNYRTLAFVQGFL